MQRRLDIEVSRSCKSGILNLPTLVCPMAPRRPRVRGLDCEMVGVGPRGKRSILIRVSVVSRRGKARPRP